MKCRESYSEQQPPAAAPTAHASIDRTGKSPKSHPYWGPIFEDHCMIISAQSPCLSTSRQSRRHQCYPNDAKRGTSRGVLVWVLPRPPSPASSPLQWAFWVPRHWALARARSHVSRTFTSSTPPILLCLSGQLRTTGCFLFHFTILYRRVIQKDLGSTGFVIIIQ